jgi:hypothetical protein
MEVDLLYKGYSEAGFNFSKNLITNYCLSLYTKPFVILSGTSGTGKTKIAQLFQPFFPKEEKEYDITKKKNIGKDYITLTLTEGIINGDGRGNFKNDDLPLLLSNDEFSDYKKERKKLLDSSGADNFSELYDMTLIDDDNVEYKIQFYIQRAKSPLIRARFKSKYDATDAYDLQPYLKKKYKVGDVVQLEKIEEKKFKIIKAKDDEIIDLERSIKIKTYDNNIALISVKSDWTDSSGIMGFYNIIEKRYHIGPFLKHLLYAIENPDVPFFLILDEMNLSKIEYYLSDILSVLETRIPDQKTGKIITEEKVILHSASSSHVYILTDDEYFDLIPSKINIPINFYITGTINVDETTYIPSPKVLDRANVIEFNEVNLEKYFNNTETEDSSMYSLKEIPDFTKPVISSQKNSRTIPSDIKKELIEINKILKKYNMQFGYRIASEISLYILNVIKYVNEPTTNILPIALDYQITQKILPKINGTQAKIEKAIVSLFNYFNETNINLDNIDHQVIASYNENQSKYPKTTAKIKNIHNKLITYGYASSIE